MASQINVQPVVGYTPVQVATELRTLIRDGIWHKAKQIPGGWKPKPKSGMIASYKMHIEQSLINQDPYLDAIDQLLTALSKEATLRKPTLTRQKVEQVRANLQVIRARKKDAMTYASHLTKKDDPDSAPTDVPMVVQELLEMCERAYSLVQALPTIESPAIGREANTIRAITAILKVHYGLEVQGTVEKLPEMMPLLLEAIKKPQEPAPPIIESELWIPDLNPKYDFKLTVEPVLPWQIFTQNDASVGEFTIPQTEKITEVPSYGWLPPGVPLVTSKGWNGGDCSPLIALKALIAHGVKYSDQIFTLRDSTGIIFATAEKNKPLELFNGFADVLYHLRKEHKENAKSQGQVAPPLVSNSNSITFTTVSGSGPF